MDRRRMMFAFASTASLSTAGGPSESAVRAQGARMRGAEYLGAISVMRHAIGWVEDEVRRLLDERDESDEEWRVDVLAPFAVVLTMQEASLGLEQPAKYDEVHATWLDALAELEEAGRQLRFAVLDEVERAYGLGERALDRASDLLEEVDDELPGRVEQLMQSAA